MKQLSQGRGVITWLCNRVPRFRLRRTVINGAALMCIASSHSSRLEVHCIERAMEWQVTFRCSPEDGS